MIYFNEKFSEEKVFKDFVYCYIYVRDCVIWELIGIVEF